MAIPQKVTAIPAPQTIEDVLIKGDLAKLTEQQRTEYYMRLCQSVGLNPMTKPFSYLTLNGKLVLYATRDCAEQLRRLHGISIEILSQEKADGLLTIHVRARDRDGRQDEDLGVVAFGDHLKGEVAANTVLKAITKAKRRVTLSISGLGFLDETEVQDIPAHAKQVPDKQIVNETGELISNDQINELIDLCVKAKKTTGALAKRMGVESIADLPAAYFNEAKGILESIIKDMPK
jgi:hypothetical protein